MPSYFGLGDLRKIGTGIVSSISQGLYSAKVAATDILNRAEAELIGAIEPSDNALSFVASLKSSAPVWADRFRVTFMAPAIIGSNANDTLNLTLMCDEASIPSRAIRTKSVKFNGLAQQRPIGIDYSGEKIGFRFVVQNHMQPIAFFQNWMNNIVNPDTREIAFYRDFTSTVQIDLLDRDHNTVLSVFLLDAYPVGFDTVSLGSGSTDLVKVTVQMAFKIWQTSIPLPSDTGIIVG